MGSSEIVDSGGFSGRRCTNFMQTCTLLSRYLKEKKGSFEDLQKLGLNSSRRYIQPKIEEEEAPSTTMNLLPMLEKKPDFSGSKTEGETAPLTIFYGGQVIVFNDFPAEKANEIMTLASNASAAAVAPPPAESITGIQNLVPAFGMQGHPRPSDQPDFDSDLPIARKNSLTRFLEKRKDRITANKPYENPARKPAGAWLGLGPQFTPKLEHRRSVAAPGIRIGVVKIYSFKFGWG